MLSILRDLLGLGRVDNLEGEISPSQPETNSINEPLLPSPNVETPTPQLVTPEDKTAIEAEISRKTQDVKEKLDEIASTKSAGQQRTLETKNDELTENNQTSSKEVSVTESPKEYYDKAVDYIKEHAYKSGAVDWDTLLKQVQPAIDNAKEISDTHMAIRYIIQLLGDNHSSFRSKEQIESTEDESVQEYPTGKMTKDGFAYLHIPGMSGDKTINDKYAEAGQNVIRDLDEYGHPQGWIVDLRQEYGGAVYGVLAALGPLLGDGKAGEFIDSKGKRYPFGYENGKAVFNGEVVAEVDNPYHLKNPNTPIVVLTSKSTASAGEIVLLGMGPDVYKIGEPTTGVPTGNNSVELSDGSMMVITEAITADRTGKTYDSSIEPDESVEVDWDHIGDDQDPTLVRANEWLKSKVISAK